MQTPDTINLDGFPVVHQGTYDEIRVSPENGSAVIQYAYKTFRAVPNGVGVVSGLDSMINDIVTQQSQINNVERSRSTPMSVVITNIAGIRVPALRTIWYKNSDISKYLRHNADADKMLLVTDIACELAALHSVGVIHGNLHPGNVLITDDFRASITDAGVYTSAVQTLFVDHLRVPSQWPYKPPEELRDGIRTSHTDVYSFACTVYSVYAEQPLFRRIAYTCARGVKKIIEQGHWEMIGNSKPGQMREDLWELLGRCWAIDPAGRPTMKEVVEKMRGFRSD